MNISLSEGIDSLTNFKRDTTAFLAKLKETGQPAVLTVNGKAEIVVQDAGSYQRLLDLADRAEMMEFLERSQKDIDKGRTIPAKKVMAKIAKKLGIKPSE